MEKLCKRGSGREGVLETFFFAGRFNLGDGAERNNRGRRHPQKRLIYRGKRGKHV